MSVRGVVGSLIFLVALALAAQVARNLVHAPPSVPQPGGTADGPTGEFRIVALSPGVAITLDRLGLADRVVGRHGYDLALDPALPVCGDQGGLDYEQLIRVEPTHVVLEWGDRPLPGTLTKLASERGWTIVNLSATSADELLAACDTLERTFIVEPALAQNPGAKLARAPMSDSFRHAWRARTGLEDAGRVLLLMDADPPAALGPGSFHHGILVRLGATPAIEQGSPYMRLDAEDVLRLAPDTIVLVQPRSRSAPPAGDADAQDRLGALASLNIPAVRRGRVLLIDHPYALTPSTAMIGFADRLAEKLAPASEPAQDAPTSP